MEIREIILSWLPVLVAVITSVLTSRSSNIISKMIKRDTKEDYKKLYDKVDNLGYQNRLLEEQNSVLKRQNEEIIKRLDKISTDYAKKLQIEEKNSNDLNNILQSTIKAIDDIGTVKAQNKAILNREE